MADLELFQQAFSCAICFFCIVSSLKLNYYVNHSMYGFLLKKSNITISGTRRERGLLTWNKELLEDCSSTLGTEELYDLPFGISSCLSSQSWVRYVPFCPWKGRSKDNMSQGQVISKGAEVIDEFAL